MVMTPVLGFPIVIISSLHRQTGAAASVEAWHVNKSLSSECNLLNCPCLQGLKRLCRRNVRPCNLCEHRSHEPAFWDQARFLAVKYITRFPSEKCEDNCLAPNFVNLPKIMIGGAIAVDVKGPLIIFEKDKGITNTQGNVDNNSYINHVLPKLVEFYDEVRTHLSKRERDFSVTDPSWAEY
jgi:hypothetical protein